MPRGPDRVELRVASRISIAIDEPSDVVALPFGGFLVISDTERDGLWVRDSGHERVPLPGVGGGESSFEAVAYDAEGSRLFVASEEDRTLYVFRWGEGTAATLESRRRLPGEGEDNKGIEGMAYLPADRSPTGSPALLVANERSPRELLLLDHDGEARAISIDKDLRKLCDDFSGLAMDPRNGRVHLCSDESATLAELRLFEDGGELRAEIERAFDLRDEAGRALQRVEGVAIDAGGGIHVLLENARALCRMV